MLMERKPLVRHQLILMLSLATLSFAVLMLSQPVSAQEVLTNDAVVKMVKAGLEENLIVDMIRTKPGKYSTAADDVIKLKQDGVTENEIAAMLAKGSAESPGAPAAGQPASAGAAPDVPCPAQYGAYYLDGNSWKAMSRVATEGVAGKPRPFGAKAVARFRDAAAPIAVGESPKFCLYGGAQFSRNIVIASVDVKGDHREIQMARAGITGTTSGIPDKKIQAIELKQVSDYAVEYLAQEPSGSRSIHDLPDGPGQSGLRFRRQGQRGTLKRPRTRPTPDGLTPAF
jgi:hypothetical protein